MVSRRKPIGVGAVAGFKFEALIHRLMQLMRTADAPRETSSLEFEIASLIRRVLVSAQENRYEDTPHMEILKRVARSPRQFRSK